MFEDELLETGLLEPGYPIPYSDLHHLNDERRRKLIEDELRSLEFGHTLADQIGGQLDAGFLLSGFFEDRIRDPGNDPISRYIDSFIATRAVKP